MNSAPSSGSSSHDAWLVDLDGTLYAPRFVQLAMAAELALTGAHRIAALRAFRRCHEELRHEFAAAPELEFFPSPFQEQLRRTAEKLGMSPEWLRSIVMSWMVQRPGKWLRMTRRTALLREIREFRAAGGKTALVSDYPADAKLRALGARDAFDLVVANGEHPRLTRLKPSPDGYRIAAAELGIAPGRCLVLGDRDDADGAAARAAGMAFCLIG
ncbi:MAG TPA: HAD-IA family hydrolase [Polyangiaceae bacterium]|nr:HAD-IA family hydrolase [Polyangiaceae bacterium]